MTSRARLLAALRSRWWRLVYHHVSAWLDRRFEARHLREYGWPMKLGMGPFSMPEARWHECGGHEWERIDWPYGRAVKRGHRPDRVTRCRKCGAARCDSYHPQEAFFLGIHGKWTSLHDAQQQAVRCTLERHHSEAHDYLAGTRIEVGG